jgi:hypothetical protein
MEIHGFGVGWYEALRIGPRVVGLLITEDGDYTLFRNMDNDTPDYKASYNRRSETLC